jgi:hypothetical protein
MNRKSGVRQLLTEISPWLAVSASALLYAVHFYFGGGRTKLITDSAAYLAMARGDVLGAPYSSRVLEPFIASILSSALGVSNLAAFQILTPVSLFVSLLLLRRLISNLGGSVEWQAAVLLAFGCGLAVTFGYTPVMIDPLLLLFACLTAVTVNRGHFLAAVIFASLAALTKEYGVLLGFVVCAYAFRRGKPSLAWSAALFPLIIFLVVTLTRSRSAGGFQSWTSFLSAMFGYHAYLFRFRGASEYPKLLYMWLWSAMWPALVIAAGVILSRVRKRIKMADHEAGFTVIVVALALLLLGDWGRALLIAVPFACAVVTAHPLARNPQFAALVAMGGLSTALARPFHGELAAPHVLTLTMTIVSCASSVIIGFKLLTVVSRSSAKYDPDMKKATAGIALQ